MGYLLLLIGEDLRFSRRARANLFSDHKQPCFKNCIRNEHIRSKSNKKLAINRIKKFFNHDPDFAQWI